MNPLIATNKTNKGKQIMLYIKKETIKKEKAEKKTYAVSTDSFNTQLVTICSIQSRPFSFIYRSFIIT